MSTDPQQRSERRAKILRRATQVGVLIGVVIFVVSGALAIVQTERAENIRTANIANKAAAAQAAATAATQYSELSTQYSKLFEACQKSAECLASAPAQQAPVIIQGAPGAPGKSVTPAEIADALNAYCSAHQNCIGDPGAAGAAGQDGSDGAAGTNGADGATGATGPAGPAGADGRGVASISCVSTGPLSTAFEFTLTDGTVFDVTGSCIPS